MPKTGLSVWFYSERQWVRTLWNLGFNPDSYLYVFDTGVDLNATPSPPSPVAEGETRSIIDRLRMRHDDSDCNLQEHDADILNLCTEVERLTGELGKQKEIVTSYDRQDELLGTEFEGVDEVTDVIRLLKQERDALALALDACYDVVGVADSTMDSPIRVIIEKAKASLSHSQQESLELAAALGKSNIALKHCLEVTDDPTKTGEFLSSVSRGHIQEALRLNRSTALAEHDAKVREEALEEAANKLVAYAEPCKLKDCERCEQTHFLVKVLRRLSRQPQTQQEGK